MAGDTGRSVADEQRRPRPAATRRTATDPVLLVGVALSVAVGVVCFLRTDVATTMSLLAGLICLALTLQVQLLLKEQREDAQLSRQRQLLANIDKVEWLPEAVHRLVTSVVRIESNYAGAASAAALRRVFDATITNLKDLERGHFIVDFDDLDLVYDLTRECRSSLRATSVQGVDLSFWLSPPGKQYWSLHLAALERGVQIERIFVYDDWNHDLDQLAREQATAGVNVMRVAKRDLPARLCSDMILWDTGCGYESRQNAAGEATDNFFTVDEQDIARMDAHYAVIASCAHSFDPESEPCVPALTPQLSAVPNQPTSIASTDSSASASASTGIPASS